MSATNRNAAGGESCGADTSKQSHADHTPRPLADHSICPRFDKCSVPLCPLDADMHKRRYLAGEPMCRYLLEYAKPDAEARFKRTLSVRLFEAMARACPIVFARGGYALNRFKRASVSGSRLERRVPGKEVRV